MTQQIQLICGGEIDNSVQERLQTLANGVPVALLINDSNTISKKRVGDPVLYITPMALFKADPENLMFSMQGGGCEIMPVKSLKKIGLWRIGLSVRASTMLIKELNMLFNIQESSNG